MKDIIFYYTKVNDSKFGKLKEKYPYAKFVKTKTTNIVDIVKSQMKFFTSDFIWFIDLNLLGWEEYINYDVSKWDKKYVHIFESFSAAIYLVPGSINLTETTNNEFKDKKIIKANKLRIPPYDVFFISFDESGFERNLRFVKQKRPDVTHISGIKGIFKSHLEAAKLSTTDFFWVVDADATVLDSFDFDYIVPEWDFDVVHIWKSLNLINKLEYGHGGVKLIPKHLLLNADETTAVDITTSIGANIKIMDDISNINNFATNPLVAWRTAFRECAKLASGIIPRGNQDETNYRLDTWCNKGGNRPLGEYVKGGASAGQWFGKTYKDNKEMLSKINDYNWLAAEFEQHVKMFPPDMFKDQEVTNSEDSGNTEEITEAQALAIS